VGVREGHLENKLLVVGGGCLENKLVLVVEEAVWKTDYL
jgi:hypothetical protein